MNRAELIGDTRTVTAAIAGGASEPVPPSGNAGRALVGRYHLLELIGAGGAGEVYAGHDPQLDRPVAVKRLRADLAGSADRVLLAQEARINARLEHPNIVRVYDYLTVGSDDYIVSEYIDGCSLAELLVPGRTDIEGHLAIALAIIRGLAHAHSQGIVHLDLKTENVLIGRDGVPKIADFGIAQLLDGAATPDDQRDLVIRGTFRSMSPEQTLGSPADTRSDLFSFGTLLYELFGGLSPFHVRGNRAETIRRIREHHPLPLSELRSDVPVALSELVRELHRKDPADRPRSAHAVEALLQELFERRVRGGGHVALGEPPVERRLLSVLTIDVLLPPPGASMELTERHLRALARFHKAARLHAERHDGHVLNAFEQRAVICLGYPRAHDNNCERAARLFLALRAALLGDELVAGAGLRAGLDVGETLLLGDTAAGPSLAAAAALCEAAGPGELLVSSRAQRILRRFFAFERRGKLLRHGEVPDRHAPALIHHALLDGALTHPAAGRALRAPLLGRESELEMLFDALGQAQAGRGSTLLVSGSPGVGKSRLLSSFHDRLAESNTAVLELRARPEDQYSPFAPFAELLAPVSPLSEAPRSRVRLSEPPQREPSVVLPEAALRAPSETYRQRVIDELTQRLLGALGAHRSLVIVVEDVHWLDHSSFELLRTLQSSAAKAPLLLVLSGRPECVPEVTSRLSVRPLKVSRLSPARALEVVMSLGPHLSHRQASQIVEAADGLPLVLEELTLAMAEGAELGAAGEVASLRVPSSLTESIDRRLQLLGVARDTAEVLACFGRETLHVMLEKVSELPDRELSAQLSRLCATGLVLEEGEGAARTLRFRHRLLRDAIYERLPVARREGLHRRIAAVAESAFGGWLAARPDLFSQHFALAGQWLKALELAVLAGEQAASKSCHFEACVHLQNALALLERQELDADDARRWELSVRRLLCPSLNASDGWAAETVQENNTRLHALGGPRTAERPLSELWALFAHACLRHDGRGVGEALALLEELPESPARDAVLFVARGNVEFYRGDFERAERSLLLAGERLEDSQTRELVLACGQELLVEGPCYLAWIYAIQGRQAPAVEQRRAMEGSPEALVVARAFGALFSTALGLLARDHETTEGRRAQRARAEGLLELAALLRHPVFQAVADVALGRLRIADGAAQEGLAAMRRGYELYEQSGTQLCLAEYAGFVAEAHLEAGEVAAARELLDRVRQQAAHPYCGFYRAEFLRLEAELLLAEGRLGEAVAVANSAVRACSSAIDRRPVLFVERLAGTLAQLRERSGAAHSVAAVNLS